MQAQLSTATDLGAQAGSQGLLDASVNGAYLCVVEGPIRRPVPQRKSHALATRGNGSAAEDVEELHALEQVAGCLTDSGFKVGV